MTTMFEVQTYTLVDGWVNCWHEDDRLLYFQTREEAQKEIDEYLSDCADAVAAGDMEDADRAGELRIHEISAIDAAVQDVCEAVTQAGYHCPDVMRKHQLTDDEDIIIYALDYLRANIDHALLEDMEEP